MAPASEDLYTEVTPSEAAHSRDDSLKLPAGLYAYPCMTVYLIRNDVIDHGVLLGGDTTINEATVTTPPT